MEILARAGGQNAIGNPFGSNGTPFWGTPHETELVPGADFGAGFDDFSMGIEGTGTPEPATVLPLGGLFLALIVQKRRSVRRAETAANRT
jgi:hypothetical protein